MHVIADTLARKLLEQQRRDVAAAIVTHVDDQTAAVEFGEKAAMKFRETPRPHIGDVQISDVTAGARVHVFAICLTHAR